MATTDEEHNGARATIREVMVLVEQSRRDVLAELRSLEAKVDARLATHTVEHERERDWRSGIYRWAVTTIVSAAGVLFAIVWSLTH